MEEKEVFEGIDADIKDLEEKLSLIKKLRSLLEKKLKEQNKVEVKK
jgi:hypothetical protein